MINKKDELKTIQKKLEDPEVWKDQKFSKSLNKRMSSITRTIEGFEKLDGELKELIELTSILDDTEQSELKKQVDELQVKIEKLSKATLLDGKFDHNQAYLSIIVGTGGKDAEDFANMLFRMYLRFFEKQEWEHEILSVSHGDMDGIKSATIFIKEYDAFGWLKSEHGVHRLVRLSPFNTKHTRETSFAGVEVMPFIEKPTLKLEESDLRIDIFRSSGPGGQSVNTTDSAVRITHIPTNISVQCQTERSQLQNKRRALEELTSRVEILQEKEFTESMKQFRSDNPNSFGHQIRSYVMHPYTMVKDHRTNHETSQVEQVLNGDLHEFLEAYLTHFHE